MELAVISNFHHRRPHRGTNSRPFYPKLNTLTTRPRIRKGLFSLCFVLYSCFVRFRFIQHRNLGNSYLICEDFSRKVFVFTLFCIFFCRIFLHKENLVDIEEIPTIVNFLLDVQTMFKVE